MRSLFLFTAALVTLTACGPLTESKYTKYAGQSQNLQLDYEAISRDLEPLVSSCSQDADCKLGELPAEPYSCADKVEGAYLVGKETEFNKFSSELSVAIEAVKNASQGYVRDEPMSESGANALSFRCQADMAEIGRAHV